MVSMLCFDLKLSQPLALQEEMHSSGRRGLPISSNQPRGASRAVCLTSLYIDRLALMAHRDERCSDLTCRQPIAGSNNLKHERRKKCVDSRASPFSSAGNVARSGGELQQFFPVTSLKLFT